MKVAVNTKNARALLPPKIEVGDKTLVSGGEEVELTKDEFATIKKNFGSEFDFTVDGKSESDSEKPSSSSTTDAGSTGGGSK